MTLSYWIEGTDKLWIKGDIAATGTTTYIRVEKTTGYTPSGDNTFIFFDDFSGSDYDATKWTLDQGFQYTVSSSNLNITNGSVKLSSVATFHYNTPCVLEVKAKDTVIPAEGYTLGGFYSSSTNGFSCFKTTTTAGYVRDDNTNNLIATSAMTTNTYYKFKFTIKDATNTGFQITDLADADIFAATNYTNDVVNEKICLGYNLDASNLNKTVAANFEHVFVRKYTTNTVTVNVIDQTTYYLLEITNSGAALTGHQFSVPASSLGTLTNTQSLAITPIVLNKTWLKTNEVHTTDGVYAYNLNDSGSTADSQYLKVTGFGNTIPASSIITGVKVLVYAKASAGTAAYIKELSLVKNGTITAVTKTPTPVDLTTSIVEYTYGSDGDMWSDTTPFLSPSLVNQSNFGVAIKVNYDDAITVSIDEVKMVIYYMTPHGITGNAVIVSKRKEEFMTDTAYNTGTLNNITINNGIYLTGV